ncbi:MAG: hypothetical protein ACJAZO_001949 [Myxococcota bacterium]|jgi:hypothetical protein
MVDVFPSPLLMNGDALSIPLDALPLMAEGTPLPVDRFGGWRSGFSPGQTTVFEIDGVNADSLPDWRAPTPGEGGVILADLTTGEFLPVMAELDAHPDATEPVLLVRPLVTLTPGHQIAVVVTTEAIDRPDRVERTLSDDPPLALVDIADELQVAVAQLAQMGLSEDTIAVITTFPIDSGRQPLQQLLDDVALPTSWSLDRVRTNDGDTRIAPRTWRAAAGSYDTPSVIGDDNFLRIDPVTGVVSAQGTGSHSLYVHIPESVSDAAPGTVPIVMFGHGIFSSPEAYLDSDEDNNGVLAILDEMGAIGIATRWNGLSTDDRITAVEAAQDFGLLPSVCDRLVETNLSVRALQELILTGDLLDDPVFQGESGQSLPRRGQLGYYGISLGGIEGAVQVASGAPLDAAVLHVGGGMWSTMLERSTQWPTFELFLLDTYPDPADRQLLYAASQLFWDPVDPVGWMDVWPSDVPVLWQESLGDEQVPNMTTRLLARSIDAPLVGIAVDAPWDFAALQTPTMPGTTGLAQFDPERPLPLDVNRPPAATGAHSIPRVWSGQNQQTITFLDPDVPGVVVSGCGSEPCSASNPGGVGNE